MNENKTKNENKIYKDALKKAFVKKILFQQKDAQVLCLNEKEEIIVKDSSLFQSQEGLNIIHKLINYLAKELASAKVDLWLKTQTDEKE
jgi:hypothetical protein